jgi:hypothetical protein
MEATCLEDRIVSALIKNGERFVIVCEVRQLPAALATLRRWAEDETLNFSYDDCAKMSVGLCRQVKQLDLAPVFAAPNKEACHASHRNLGHQCGTGVGVPHRQLGPRAGVGGSVALVARKITAVRCGLRLLRETSKSGCVCCRAEQRQADGPDLVLTPGTVYVVSIRT